MDGIEITITATLVGFVLLMAFARIREQNRLKYAAEELKQSHRDFEQTLVVLENAVGMNNPPHPGLSIRHDCLEPLGLSVTEAAKYLGVSGKQLSDVVDGISGISPEMAIRLDKAFGGGAYTWYRLQAAYDLAQAMKKSDLIEVERVTL